MFYKGIRKTINIDDYLPLKKDFAKRNRVLYLNAGPSKNGAWWLPLLEKAYAKLNVNYNNLEYG